MIDGEGRCALSVDRHGRWWEVLRVRHNEPHLRREDDRGGQLYTRIHRIYSTYLKQPRTEAILRYSGVLNPSRSLTTSFATI